MKLAMDPDPDVLSMSDSEIIEHYRPYMLVGDHEYTLDDADARHMALALRDMVREERSRRPSVAVIDESVATTEGTPGIAPAGEREFDAVWGADDRININHLAATYPYNNTGRMGSDCSIFKMVNQYTAVTAAHCVHSGSGWYAARDLVFQSPLAPKPPAPAGCANVTVPGCWDGDTPSCDYAAIALRGRNGAWCPENSYDVSWLGWNSVSNCTTGIKAYVSGYPGTPPFGWTYPTLVYHYREDGWTSCPTYPERVWYYNDTTEGQSGAPLVSYWSDGSWRVRAIHSGKWVGVFDDSNQGRRMTSDLRTWLGNNGGF